MPARPQGREAAEQLDPRSSGAVGQPTHARSSGAATGGAAWAPSGVWQPASSSPRARARRQAGERVGVGDRRAAARGARSSARSLERERALAGRRHEARGSSTPPSRARGRAVRGRRARARSRRSPPARACEGACRRCPRIRSPSRSGRAARSWAARRTLLVPTRAPRRQRLHPRAPQSTSSAGPRAGPPSSSSPPPARPAGPWRSARRGRSRLEQRLLELCRPSRLSSPLAPRSPPVTIGRLEPRPAPSRRPQPACASASALRRVPMPHQRSATAAAGRGAPPAVGRRSSASSAGLGLAQAEQLAHDLEVAWPRSSPRLRRRIVGSCSSRR